MVKHFLTLEEYSSDDIKNIINTGIQMKQDFKKGNAQQLLAGKTLAMIFEKPSTRTRVSFDAAMYQLGGYAINLTQSEIGLGKRESICDVARTLSSYCDGVMIRTFEHEIIEEFAKNSSIPVINGLTNYLHPCQAMADAMTILEYAGKFDDVKVAFLGDGNNVAHSLMVIADKVGFDLVVCTPKGYEPDQEIMETLGKNISVTNDIADAVGDADFIYTDVWASMGQEEEKKKREKKFRPYQVNKDLVAKAKQGVKILHCLPAHRGEEITDDVIDSGSSIVFQQAENRLHVQKSILVELLK